MAFKPNYNQQRAERNRAKEQKKQEKLQRREEGVAARRAGEPEGTETQDDVLTTGTDSDAEPKTDTNNA
ncbi:hypothetical protein TSH100_11520 [Azospirillum sp. TSH100]|uniref:hypothetical protein n=1 Tax=Azospirillum sp. TSH100 TaxID=652764 RepID=UPI000D62140C|nr:hypothetical protein [Azospirillum sp. TSH100]PWC86999.1 hypothetical protein TSH100_11520 [Azospirillum sp. TSH100]QCG91506.1 hypothetical protein E6C72_27365 [Azospirillum sp. TSH100]